MENVDCSYDGATADRNHRRSYTRKVKGRDDEDVEMETVQEHRVKVETWGDGWDPGTLPQCYRLHGQV